MLRSFVLFFSRLFLFFELFFGKTFVCCLGHRQAWYTLLFLFGVERAETDGMASSTSFPSSCLVPDVSLLPPWAGLSPSPDQSCLQVLITCTAVCHSRVYFVSCTYSSSNMDANIRIVRYCF